jgi:hypothetical protein
VRWSAEGIGQARSKKQASKQASKPRRPIDRSIRSTRRRTLSSSVVYRSDVVIVVISVEKINGQYNLSPHGRGQ